eukprot:6207391-Pleurochrysis_carterae.AAC.2
MHFVANASSRREGVESRIARLRWTFPRNVVAFITIAHEASRRFATVMSIRGVRVPVCAQSSCTTCKCCWRCRRSICFGCARSRSLRAT